MRLLESSARRQLRRGGMVVSVVVHTAAIALAVVATARARVPDERPAEPLIYVVPPPIAEPKRAPGPTCDCSGPSAPGTAPTLPTPDLSTIPEVIPPPGAALDPALDPSRGLFGPPAGLGAAAAGAGSASLGPGAPLAAEAVERQVVLVGAPPRPRYPEPLRQAGVEGRVVVRFVVDTAGRVERGSIAVTSSSHALFAGAVEPLVAGLRFRPAEAAGHRVRQLVEMPFEFVLGGR